MLIAFFGNHAAISSARPIVHYAHLNNCNNLFLNSNFGSAQDNLANYGVIHDSRGGRGEGGCLAYTPPPEKILSLYPPPPPPKIFFWQKMGKLGKKWRFLEIFWPTLKIFTNLP